MGCEYEPGGGGGSGGPREGVSGLGGGAGNSEWMEKFGMDGSGWEWLGVDGVVTPVNGEQGVNRLGTSRLEVGGVDRVGGVNFQLSSG